MATSGRIRSTRRLRNWMVDQVNSGQYPGLVWDDVAKTMFRIPWKHAGKQDFRSDEDAAIFKAWAEFKGKLSADTRSDPASWKTRLRCALNKSPEFSEVNERSQLDISEPYKVYRLVPVAEQEGLAAAGTKEGVRAGRRKRRSDSDSEEENLTKKIKEEVVSLQPISMAPQQIEAEREIAAVPEDATAALLQKNDSSVMEVNEIQLNFMIETLPAAGALPALIVSVKYLGQEVLRREIYQRDIRIAYYPSSVSPPPPSALSVGAVERVSLPEPGSLLPECSISGVQLQACSTLLNYMEKGVLLTSNTLGVLAQRFCQGRVFWRGPHAGESGPHKLDRTAHPVFLFNKQTFEQELDIFRSSGGTPPECGVTLCFGEELDTEDTSSKLITVHISLPWATQQVQEAQSFRESVAFLQTLASQSPLSEVTLNLVGISSN
ncbi:interferon regulatory factor 9 isoform X1 [Anguilla rostrata]|uniref:interferon regulatory factor 9 isoform X1 n=1 Tax=Anguilla rostrata TaxID=7938 RepID=UPI0030CFED7B